MPLPREHFLDELATAYVQVVAAAAGATIAVSRHDYGVDGTLKHVVRLGNRYVESGFPVDFQLKGTAIAAAESEHVRYDLKVRNYDLIVTRPGTATPYYLFLVCFRSNQREWILVEDERLLLGASAFWWTASGQQTLNTTSVRLRIPAQNRLTLKAISDMLVASKERFFS